MSEALKDALAAEIEAARSHNAALEAENAALKAEIAEDEKRGQDEHQGCRDALQAVIDEAAALRRKLDEATAAMLKGAEPGCECPACTWLRANGHLAGLTSGGTGAGEVAALRGVLESAAAVIHALLASPDNAAVRAEANMLAERIDRGYYTGLTSDGKGARNQCDGCARGIPVNENGAHVGPGGPWSGDRQVCTKDRYAVSPAPASIDTKEHCAIRLAGGSCPVCPGPTAPAESATPTCDPQCGTVGRLSLGFWRGNVRLCSRACAQAGRPLNPTREP